MQSVRLDNEDNLYSPYDNIQTIPSYCEVNISLFLYILK